MSKPKFYDAKSELISAMSSLNTHDERKPWTGPFLTDEIPEVKNGYMILFNAFDYADDKNIIPVLRKAIIALKVQVDGEALDVTHSMIAHSIEHIEAAIDVLENGKRPL